MMSFFGRSRLALIVLLVAVVAPWLGGGYVTGILVGVAVYAIVGIGLDLLFGFTGQLSLGHAAFVAVGGYTSGILATRAHVPFLLALLIAGITAGVLGYLVAMPALRLSGLYQGMVTLAIGIAVPDLLGKLPDSWAGGRAGTAVITKISFGFFDLSHTSYYYFVLIVAVLLAILARNLTRSAIGRLMIAVRDNSLVAEGVGVNVTHYKTLIFAISGVYAGIAGALQAHYVGFISPEQYDLWQSIIYLVLVVLGGAGTIFGPVVGAIFFVTLPEILRGTGPAYAAVLTGVVMVLVLMLMPRGLIGLLKPGTATAGYSAGLALIRRRSRSAIKGAPEGTAR